MTDQARKELEGGSYEIIRSRLLSQGATLREKLTQLNGKRQAVFGAIEPSLVATERVTTAHKCTPRDLAFIGGEKFLFGYNVQIGLKSVTDIEDVFAVYRYDAKSHSLTREDPEVIGDSQFRVDLANLYKFYRHTRFAKFLRIGAHLYFAFRIGKDPADIKCFKWLCGDNGSLTYLGNRFDHEYSFPDQIDFDWKRAHRGMYREGEHPHISIEDRLFVETVGGDLTIKVEDNTATGEGIYAEEVSHEDQGLDDAEVFYAVVDSLILLKILPYQENYYRYLVYNEKVKEVVRVDSIADSCVLLPEGHGLIFSGGYLLQTGESKRFQSDAREMMFERRVASPNGEDYLYVFYNRLEGKYILMSYNLISQSVESPIVCHGYSLFPDGELIYFREDPEPQKHHVVQVWKTPYMEGEFRTTQDRESHLFKIGNSDLVRAMAECHEVLNLISKDDSFADLYIDLTEKTADIADTYFWCGHDEVFNLKSILSEIKNTAEAAISEFEKTARIRQATALQTEEVAARARETAKRAIHHQGADIAGFVGTLGELRTVRGETASLKDLRYSDTEMIGRLEEELAKAMETASRKCVEFLTQPEALDSYRARVEEQDERIPRVGKATEAVEIEKNLDEAGGDLEMLVEMVSNLNIEDATEATRIIDDISAIYSQLNGVRARLKSRSKELRRSEGEAEFAAQMKLINQATLNYIDLCDQPDKCDEYLSKLMIQLEELETKFAGFDEFLDKVTAKRDEIYNAFDTRKVQLNEEKSRRAAALVKSADRILSTIANRVAKFETVSEINGFWAGDVMAERVRGIISKLVEMGEVVKGDELQTRTKSLREDAVRQLKDRNDLFVDGKDVIRLGNHSFHVNHQDLELSIVPREGSLCFHLAGTDFFESVADQALLAESDLWEMTIASENEEVYRSEFLALTFLDEVRKTGRGDEWNGSSSEEKLEWIREYLSGRYDEGYTKGVHDEDALRILEYLFEADWQAELLRYLPEERALALLYWHAAGNDEMKEKISALRILHKRFPYQVRNQNDIDILDEEISRFVQENPKPLKVFQSVSTALSAEYLYFEMLAPSTLSTSAEAGKIVHDFQHYLTVKRLEKDFAKATEPLPAGTLSRFEAIREWINVTIAPGEPEFVLEAATLLSTDSFTQRAIKELPGKGKIENMAGSHPQLSEGSYQFDYYGINRRVRRFADSVTPRFRSYQKGKIAAIESKKTELRLSEFKPKVLSSFVRNRLLDRVYLPMIGDNLAKQIGTAGEETRTDRMGLLLLISPPGYGKTTLMEYVANRLGLIFMKINGPAIGHDVTSLDPENAPNAAAREEILKLNFSLEAGDNVMIYLDDIQHCHPEFLQKFISLCDAQRKIEGVWNGRSKTYDLRGKRACVVMAGNPYTESGGKFQIPDMLANRADTYNLGDVAGGHREEFESSYLENCVGSNRVLSRLATQGKDDVIAVIRLARGDSREDIDFEGSYSAEELEDMALCMRKLMRVRDTILRVNEGYIQSAAIEDDFRTEPAFRLQGSYRNMNRLAERIHPLMSDEEVEREIIEHYENESQTLTNSAEANLLKFREIEGVLSEEEVERWGYMKETFARKQFLGGQGENDPVARVVASLLQIEQTIGGLSEPSLSGLERIVAELRSEPISVEVTGPAPAPAATEPSKKTSPAKSKPKPKRKVSG